MKMIHLDPPITPPKLPNLRWISFFSFPEPSDFRLRHLGGPIIQAWTQRQHGRHQHGPDHKGIHHDAEDENKAHLVGDCHTSKHHAGLSSITARKRCNLKWVSITPVNDCQPTCANCFKKANQPSKCMEMSSFRTLILNHHFTHRQYQPANPQMFIPSIESESKDQPGCGNGRTRGRQGQLYWLVIAKALKMDPDPNRTHLVFQNVKKQKVYRYIPVSRNPSNTRITSYHLNLANCHCMYHVSLPQKVLKGRRHAACQLSKGHETKLKNPLRNHPAKPCLLSEFPNAFEEEDIIILMVGQSKIFYRSQDLHVSQGSKAKPNMMVKVNKGIVQSRPGMCVFWISPILVSHCIITSYRQLRKTRNEGKLLGWIFREAPAGPLFVMYVGDNPVIPVHSKNPSS